MKQSKPEWALKLAQALERWCRDNGYMRKTELGSELRISGKPWSDISAGTSIIGDVSAYARVFLRTGLTEADPRTIPPRRYYMRGGNVSAEKIRAWSEGEWQKWLRSEEALAIKDFKTPSIVKARERVPQVPALSPLAKDTVGAMMDAWVGTLARQVLQELNIHFQVKEAVLAVLPEVVDKVVERFRQQNSLGLMLKEPTLNVGQLTRVLREALLAGTPKDRDEIFRKHGEALRDLLPVLDSSTRSDSNQREMELKMAGEFKDRK